VLGFGKLPRMKLQTAKHCEAFALRQEDEAGSRAFYPARAKLAKVEITSDVPEAIVRSAVDEIRKLARN